MGSIPPVIGYDLDKALQKIGRYEDIIIETTSTPYEDKILERQGISPVVIRQKEKDGKIILTTSQFKL